MNRQLLGAVTLTLVMFSAALGEEFTAMITKVENGQVTFTKMRFLGKGKKSEMDEPTTLPAATGIKVSRFKFDKESKKIVAGEPLENGLKNDLFTNLKIDEVVAAVLITDADHRRILEIRAASRRTLVKAPK